MAGTEYTLTGFDDFLERRRVAFFEPLPSTRICGACGVVPSHSLILPCGHVLCKACKLHIAKGDEKCPIDGMKFTEAAVMCMRFKQSDLEQHRVFCFAGGSGCDFAGRLGDLKEHLIGCCNDQVRCAECQQSLRRSLAVQHCRKCGAKSALQQTASSTAIASAVEKLRGVKRDLEAVWERASSERFDQDAVVKGANTLVERMNHVERELLQEARRSSAQELDFVPKLNKTVVTAGPYRAASKPGVFMTTCKFSHIFDGYNELSLIKRAHTLSTSEVVLAGYTFVLDCMFQKQDNEDVLLTFILLLTDGAFNDSLEWPFSKKVTLILSHPSDETKDVRLSVKAEDHEMVKKPAPESWNNGILMGTVPWKDIEFHGLVLNDTLYINVEFD